jgi:hypothetical protein
MDMDDGATTDVTVFDETVVFLKYFKDLKDPRVIGAQVLARRCAFSERPRSSQWQAANIGAGVIRRGEAGL